jgi:hypothetical protein
MLLAGKIFRYVRGLSPPDRTATYPAAQSGQGALTCLTAAIGKTAIERTRRNEQSRAGNTA